MKPFSQEKKHTVKADRVKRYASTNVCLSNILARLYIGETLSIKALALECEVSLRTMQRYINERLNGFPIEKKGDRFHLSWEKLFENLDTKDQTVLHILKAISRQQGTIFYQKAQKFLSTMLQHINGDDNYHFPIYPIATDMVLEKLHLLDKAVREKRIINCRYKPENKTYHLTLRPLKILNFNTHWYLAALSKEKFKKYRIDKCSDITITDKKFTITKHLQSALDKTSSVWFDPDKTPYEVRIFIDKTVADFFEKNPINPTQVVTGKDSDGGIEITLSITHDMEIVPIIKQWLPHLHILSPERIGAKIKKEISEYLVPS